TNASGHTSSESSRAAELINETVKIIMNNTVFNKLNTKIAAVDKKVDSKFAALEKSIADVYRNTDIKFAALNPRFDALDTKIDAVDKKVDSNFISLTKSIESLEKLMNTKFAAVDTKFAALSKENKIYQKFTLGLGTLILGAAFKEEIMALVMKLFGS
nr:hypothetical protein [Gammaproteobacteria bacterium]